MEKRNKEEDYRRYTKAELKEQLESIGAPVNTSHKLPKDHFVRACLEHLPAVNTRTLTLQSKRSKEMRHSESRSPPATETGSMNRAVDKIREQRRGRESVETKAYVPAFL